MVGEQAHGALDRCTSAGLLRSASIPSLLLATILVVSGCGSAVDQSGPSPSPAPSAASPSVEIPGLSSVPEAKSPDGKATRLQRRAEKLLRNRPDLLKLPKPGGGGPVNVRTDGILGELNLQVGVRGRAAKKSQAGASQTQVGLAVANIPNRTSTASWGASMRTLTGPRPDFISLNEVSSRSTASLEAVAPGYSAYRAPFRDTSRGAASQSLNNALLYRADTWTEVASGVVRVVDDDQGFLGRKPFVWDRFAVWAVLQRSDGVNVSVLSTHMPTNPGKFPAQHGSPGQSRISQYAQGMDTVVAMTRQLSEYGAVFVAGDMNSHPGQGSWTAASKLNQAGYAYVKDRGVMYLFHNPALPVSTSREVPVASDHAALLTTFDISAALPR